MELVRQIRDDWPLRSPNDAVSRYIDGVARRLIRAGGEPGSEGWRVEVTRSFTPTAFAVGNRYIVISDGLLAYSANESQLAAVIAHEMGHLIEGHFCRGAHRRGADYRVGKLIQHYDAAAEEEADAQAMGLLREGGFDPGAMADVLRCLASRNAGFRAPLERRARRLEELLARIGYREISGDSSAYRSARELVIEDFKRVDPAGSPLARWSLCQ